MFPDLRLLRNLFEVTEYLFLDIFHAEFLRGSFPTQALLTFHLLNTNNFNRTISSSFSRVDKNEKMCSTNSFQNLKKYFQLSITFETFQLIIME